MLAAAFGVWFLVTAVLVVLILTMPRSQPPGGILPSPSLSSSLSLWPSQTLSASSSAPALVVTDGAATAPRAAPFAS